MKVLVTGAAGFIGLHVAQALLARGDEVVGIDNLNDYYAVQLKHDRLALLTPLPGFRFQPLDIADRDGLMALFASERFDRVVHLAAQAGVRYSITHPQAYGEANLVGFLNMLEACRQHPAAHLVYASSSSVYGGNQKTPFSQGNAGPPQVSLTPSGGGPGAARSWGSSEADAVDHPVSLYAATKKANELMAHTYSHLYGLPTTGLRFFTVYGPWGRPDMAYFSFTKAILAGEPIQVFNQGQLRRDFTYIDDIVRGVVAVLDRPATPDPAFDAMAPHPGRSNAPYRVFNIGNQDPVPLGEFIATIEAALGREAHKVYLPMQPGDVLATHADVTSLTEWTGERPATPLAEGIARFVAWFRRYHRLD